MFKAETAFHENTPDPVKPATHTTPTKTAAADSRPCLPNAACLSALRAWYEGMHSRDAVMRYLSDRIAPGQSARGVLGGLRRQLIDLARARHRNDLAAVFEHPERVASAGAPATRVQWCGRSMCCMRHRSPCH